MLYAFRIQYAMLCPTMPCHAMPCHAAAQILCLWSSMQPAHRYLGATCRCSWVYTYLSTQYILSD